MKKLILILTGFAFALCCTLWSGCKDDCPPCGVAYKTIPQEMKDWALFGEGSWWVYRLAEDTTVFDTVRFSSRSDFRSNLTTCDDHYAPSIECSQTITYNLQHSNIIYFPRYNNNDTIGGFDQIVLYFRNGGGLFLNYESCIGFSNSGVVFGFPILIGEKYNFHCLVDTFNNFELHKKKYSNVFYTNYCKTINQNPNSIQQIYWANKIGLIKIKLINSQSKLRTWELINYEVKQ